MKICAALGCLLRISRLLHIDMQGSMRALVSWGRLWPWYIFIFDRIGGNRAFHCNSIPEVDRGNTGLYIIDGGYFHNTSDFASSEDTPGLQYLLGNATLLILHCPSDL